MPRLSADTIKQGLLHSDVDVRFAALHYFAEAHSPDPSVMQVVIDALDRYGRTTAFRFLNPITLLTQSQSTVRWAVEELTGRSGRPATDRDYLGIIARLLCHADPRLVLPHQTDLQTAPAFGPEFRTHLARRIRNLSRDGDTLWRELEAVCEEGKDKQYLGDVRWTEGLDLVEELARQGERHAGRAMELLAVEIENYEGHPLAWLEPLIVRLAGELRHEPAVPLIVKKLHEDGDVLNEQCQYALVKIGTDAVIQAVGDAYPAAEWHFRLYASGVLGGVHSDLAVRVGTGLLKSEPDLDLQVWLAQALVDQLSTEGNDAACRTLRDDPDLRELRDKLIAACALTGQSYPELEEWRKEREDESRRKPFMFGGPALPPAPPAARVPSPPRVLPPAPVQRAGQKVGRNDPCPCGSGKKFKKCCLSKADGGGA
ncbi:MAG: preprotein translocase subunit SecA [Bryobacterales bacterium]|nr:preprotein translocase subunit SecA [Bryobacterales bacterium]